MSHLRRHRSECGKDSWCGHKSEDIPKALVSYAARLVLLMVAPDFWKLYTTLKLNYMGPGFAKNKQRKNGRILFYIFAVIPGTMADYMQNKGQESVNASEANVILSSEPLWAAMLSAMPIPGPRPPPPQQLLLIDIHEYEDLEATLSSTGSQSVERSE